MCGRRRINCYHSNVYIAAGNPVLLLLHSLTCPGVVGWAAGAVPLSSRCRRLKCSSFGWLVGWCLSVDSAGHALQFNSDNGSGNRHQAAVAAVKEWKREGERGGQSALMLQITQLCRSLTEPLRTTRIGEATIFFSTPSGGHQLQTCILVPRVNWRHSVNHNELTVSSSLSLHSLSGNWPSIDRPTERHVP